MEATGIAFIFMIIAIVAVGVFEFINGFHDTANAVATVIYTKTLKPTYAVMLSGAFNFLGLMVSAKIAVAMGMIKLLPMSDLMGMGYGESISLVMALLITAILWNLGTWYYGIPCSSSHTMIGAILGSGLAFYYVHGGDGVNWDKAKDIGLSLLISPLFGFSVAIMLMFVLRQLVSNKEIFKQPKEDGSAPPLWIRAILVSTCSLVSFFHGSNDGQKGVGLLLIILLAFMPIQYSLNSKTFDIQKCKTSIEKIEKSTVDNHYGAINKEIKAAKAAILSLEADPNTKERYILRKNLQKITKTVETTLEENPNDLKIGTDELKKEVSSFKSYTDFAPTWVKLMVALCLGLGTMIGYKRIVVTIGEKIGKRHMTYAEGATAELVAASTIGLSTYYGLPVSTTHVLSSGIAGSMTASKGVKNLQAGTVKSIVLAWILTLPVTMTVSFLLYMLFRLFI
ncbi:MAG: inorganic phosphate transporter [Bacteroidetes bacterium]|nr:inorganic phosphate transporter [Bacteroidota bacterium]